ncbi:hypothetical protein RB195_001930 [Necator americanus]|uniref:Reverse transcriptase domain-containing protein n=1 Tax=Necator americanus TaxID=51031 RepID=A0ABR1DGT0_NECAM
MKNGKSGGDDGISAEMLKYLLPPGIRELAKIIRSIWIDERVVTGERQGAVAGLFLFNFAIDDITRRTLDQCPAKIILAPSGCPLIDLKFADDVIIFAESSTKLQHVVNFVSKLAAAH